MKNNLLFVLLGVVFTLCVAASTTDLMTVKPAVPKVVIVQEFMDSYSISYVRDFITKKTKEGFVIKAFTFYGHDNSKVVVVMEKY